MNDSGYATIIGLAVIVVLRLLDYFLPKGRAFKWSVKHSIAVEETENPIPGLPDLPSLEEAP